MYLKEIEISNFKMFKDTKISFKPGFNLLLGDNGVGKTTVLEAIAVALSGFLFGMEDVPTRNIYKQDVRYHIEKDRNGIPNKKYHVPTSITSKVDYNHKEYNWTRKKSDAAGSKTVQSPRDISVAVRDMVNGNEYFELWPIVSYQSASRHWISRRKDAGKKLRKELHDRRCGYIGCLEAATDMNSVLDWCFQMEWVYMETGRKPENYQMFHDIISNFMQYMNDQKECKVYFSAALKTLMYEENGNSMEIADLSAGYQSVLNMVIDLAYRVALLNPDAGEKSRFTEGIVLIDEIDSNLHPKWQWRIVEALINTFPNIQFIAATHSPIIVSSCKDANIISVDEEITYLADCYAYTVDQVLRGIFGRFVRPEKVDILITEFEKCMDYEEYAKAEVILGQAKELLGTDHPDVQSMQSEFNLEAY